MKQLVAILAVLSVAAIILAFTQGAFKHVQSRPEIPVPHLVPPDQQ